MQRIQLLNLRVEVPPAQFSVWRRSISHWCRGDPASASWEVESRRRLEAELPLVWSARTASEPEGRSESERLSEATKSPSHMKLICGIIGVAKGLSATRWPEPVRKN